jgi:hypothetical protein
MPLSDLNRYGTKKNLRASIGQPFYFVAGSRRPRAYKPTGWNSISGPSPRCVKWTARVETRDGLIVRVR